MANPHLGRITELRENLAHASAQLAYLRSKGLVQSTTRLARNKSLYFIGCADLVKVGISTDPKNRMETLAAGAPGPLRLIAVVPDAGDKESECHKTLESLHVHGEWFRYGPEVDALISRLKGGA